VKMIYKYLLNSYGTTDLDLQQRSEVLKVDLVDGSLYLWATVLDTPTPVRPRTFEVVGTGHPFSENLTKDRYLGTVFDNGFVWHVFETTGIS